MLYVDRYLRTSQAVVPQLRQLEAELKARIENLERTLATYERFQVRRGSLCTHALTIPHRRRVGSAAGARWGGDFGRAGAAVDRQGTGTALDVILEGAVGFLQNFNDDVEPKPKPRMHQSGGVSEALELLESNLAVVRSQLQGTSLSCACLRWATRRKPWRIGTRAHRSTSMSPRS